MSELARKLGFFVAEDGQLEPPRPPRVFILEHVFDDCGSCWCCPTLVYADVLANHGVWVHNEREDAH